MTAFIKDILAIFSILSLASVAQAQRGGTRPSYPSTYTAPATYSSSVAYGHQNEIITNFTSGSLFSGKATKNGSSVTNIEVGAKYLRTINANIQAGGQVALGSYSASSRTDLTVLGIGVYNFDVDFKESFFAEGGLGLFPVLNDTSGKWENQFGLYVGGGKRFPIWERVSFIPTLALVKKGDVDFAIDIQFLNFSIMF